MSTKFRLLYIFHKKEEKPQRMTHFPTETNQMCPLLERDWKILCDFDPKCQKAQPTVYSKGVILAQQSLEMGIQYIRLSQPDEEFVLLKIARCKIFLHFTLYFSSTKTPLEKSRCKNLTNNWNFSLQTNWISKPTKYPKSAYKYLKTQKQLFSKHISLYLRIWSVVTEKTVLEFCLLLRP